MFHVIHPYACMQAVGARGARRVRAALRGEGVTCALLGSGVGAQVLFTDVGTVDVSVYLSG